MVPAFDYALFAAITTAMLVLESFTWRKYIRARSELEHIRRIARDQLNISPGRRSTTAGMLALLDANRPVGVSLRRVVDELQKQLEKGYP